MSSTGTAVQTSAQISEMLNQSGGCGRAVRDCSEVMRWVRASNHFQPHKYGDWQYKPQCLKCGRTGTAVREIPPFSGNVIVEAEEAKQYAARKEAARERLRELYRLAKDREEQEAQEQWRSTYENYLRSPEWFAKRDKVLARDKGICQGCLTTKATQVHHLSYRNLGHEPLFELISVCHNCHAVVHEGAR